MTRTELDSEAHCPAAESELATAGTQSCLAPPLRVLDLFSGIGGFSLGLERVGFTTVAFCETDSYCRRILAKHWPRVPIYGDIRELSAARLAADRIECDVLTGGFPCQDISVAGRGAGLAGARSGLWREYARLIGELRPQYAIVENVTALLTRGLGEILGDLVEIGYDAEWHCIPASYLGAPHQRDRIWIVAYPGSGAVRDREQRAAPGWLELPPRGQTQPRDDGAAEPMAHADIARLERWYGGKLPQRAGERTPRQGGAFRDSGEWYWCTEPDVGRVVDGLPARVDRLRALGNAIVPQVAEFLGRAILKHAEKRPGR